MEAPWIVVLVLLGAWTLTSGILGAMLYGRGRRIQELEEENCQLVQKAGRAERVIRRVKNAARVDGMKPHEMLVEFNRLFSAVDSGPGQG